jgi:hypothetical protein
MYTDGNVEKMYLCSKPEPRVVVFLGHDKYYLSSKSDYLDCLEGVVLRHVALKPWKTITGHILATHFQPECNR